MLLKGLKSWFYGKFFFWRSSYYISDCKARIILDTFYFVLEPIIEWLIMYIISLVQIGSDKKNLWRVNKGGLDRESQNCEVVL